MADPVSPPNAEIVAAFRDLGFDQAQALLLTVANANPAVIKYRLELCHMTHEQAVAIYS